MQLKPVIFIYPTNCTFFIQLVYWKMVRGSIQLRYQVVKGGEKQKDIRQYKLGTSSHTSKADHQVLGIGREGGGGGGALLKNKALLISLRNFAE